jgi:hypothetical protein
LGAPYLDGPSDGVGSLVFNLEVRPALTRSAQGREAPGDHIMAVAIHGCDWLEIATPPRPVPFIPEAHSAFNAKTASA